jgi:MFS family permease
VVAAVYPGTWAILQLATGWFSDRVGRKPLIVLGMLVQAAALALLAAGGGSFDSALGAAALLGIGTALVYPTLIAAVSDVAQPRDRATIVGVYRFWRDSGFVAGALLVGFAADALGSGPAIAIVAALTGASGLLVAFTRWKGNGSLRLSRWRPSATSSRPMRPQPLRSSSDGPPKGG